MSDVISLQISLFAVDHPVLVHGCPFCGSIIFLEFVGAIEQNSSHWDTNYCFSHGPLLLIHDLINLPYCLLMKQERGWEEPVLVSWLLHMATGNGLPILKEVSVSDFWSWAFLFWWKMDGHHNLFLRTRHHQHLTCVDGETHHSHNLSYQVTDSKSS